MKRIIYLFFVLLIFISCDNNPCVITVYSCDDVEPDGFKYPKIYWIKFYPPKAKVGDTVMVMYEKEIRTNNLNYDTDFEITDDEKIKYIGKYWNPYFCIDKESNILNDMLYICPQKKKNSSIKINNFISFSNSSAVSSDNEIVTLEFKVPENAKSGYLYIKEDFFMFKNTLFSEEKLIIVDENGNEVIE